MAGVRYAIAARKFGVCTAAGGRGSLQHHLREGRVPLQEEATKSGLLLLEGRPAAPRIRVGVNGLKDQSLEVSVAKGDKQ